MRGGNGMHGQGNLLDVTAPLVATILFAVLPYGGTDILTAITLAVLTGLILWGALYAFRKKRHHSNRSL